KDFDLYGKKGDGLLAKLKLKLLGPPEAGRVPQTGIEDKIERMRKDISVEVIGRGGRRGGDAFSISYMGKDPYVTMEVTNTLASLFIEENLRIREQYAEGTSEFLANELARAKAELEAQEQAIRDFKERHMGSLPEQLDANLRTLDRLQLELISLKGSLKNALDRRDMLREQLALLEAGLDADQPQAAVPAVSGVVKAPPQPDPLETELERLKAELAGLLSVYKETYPDVIIVRKRIEEIERTLQARAAVKGAVADEETGGGAEASGPAGQADGGAAKGAVDDERLIRGSETYARLKEVESQIASLTKSEERIRRQIKEYERRVESTPGNEQRLADLQRDYDISFKNYQNLLEKKLNARLAENLEKRQKGERFRVLDPANLPEKPVKPNKAKIILLGAGGGAGMGLALAFLLELMNPAFRKPEDFDGFTDIPVLTVIPVHEFGKTPSRGRKRKLRLLSGDRGGGLS
ncbi:MAG TPA: hypothetical protein ENJ37_07795, partial [Deltaproteobacteria bacterium]|nr:hypothetical protein [Deltaproteobacteria bacterium]